MEATEWLNTVFNQIKTSMNRMSPMMKDIFLVPKQKSSGKTIESGNNWARDKAAAKAATEQIVMQGTTNIPITGMRQKERARLAQSRRGIESDENSPSPRRLNIHSATLSEQSEDSQPQCGHDTHTVYARETHDENNISVAQAIQGIPESIERSWRSMGETQSIDINALREEIKETISATIKEKLRSDADSVTTVSHSMTALDTNAQYWSDFSNKAVRCSHRALELQLKMAEEKINTLLYEEAPEEVLLEVAREAPGLMPEQQVRFRTDTGGGVNNPSREYGVNPIHEVHITWQEADAPLPQQSTPALSMTAQLDSAVVNRMSEYGGIQQMVRQAIQNASHEAEPEKPFLAKASVKMGNPPTYSNEHNLEKFENWVMSVL
ncbi:hypothetical protein M422DRAFT_240308 [Sphaerobolus stellatus SS14]|nr:hypothetical protein M422DRAFT_240308 [Sphaerobolus stellatus SS14]